ncbi:MAG: peptide transporter, partial [Planctomycetota bacterium]
HAQVFTLFYLSGAIMVTASQLQGGFHGGLGALWGQFFIQSDAADAAGLADRIPSWVAPSDPEVLGRRSLLMWEWAGPIALIAFTMIIGRIDNMILGYGLFRLTSDIEKLPFPMAPVGAQGILALSEEEPEEDADWDSLMPDDPPEGTHDKGQAFPDLKEDRGWRWRVFSVGAVLGLAFGTVYLGLPTVTAALLGEPVVLIPIPFIDYTQRTADVLPAVATGVSLDLGQLILGMVLPFWAMVGTAVGLAVTFIANPFLYDAGVLNAWNPGDNLQVTFFKNNVDFYLSFSLGVAAAIAVAGFWSVGKALLKARREARAVRDEEDTVWQGVDVPEGRGDIRPWLVILTYAVSTALYLGVSCWLLYLSDGRIPLSLVVVMLFYALFYTPIISYVTARLEGIAGEVINVPYVREASFILSGYEGVAVWFLPVPLHNYGSTTVFYRQCELTGTKFKSIWKSELLLTPIILVGSLAFAHFIWQLGPIPGPNYPYAQAWWEVTAEDQALLFSSTLGGFSEFERAIDPTVILAGLGIGGLVFGGLSWLGAPVFLTYGIVRGLNQTLPYAVLPQLLGALIGRYYFQRRLGLRWRQYVPVVAAGFSCGMGLVGTLGVGFTFLAKSVFQLPY